MCQNIHVVHWLNPNSTLQSKTSSYVGGIWSQMFQNHYFESGRGDPHPLRALRLIRPDDQAIRSKRLPTPALGHRVLYRSAQ